ncbi:TPA: DapH/DapD/GlmU-related protein [Vibrio cholerae]|uniref:DapH/DapD/GlmU-related protein n=2 Tax=Vibrio cholerae TaxID=666 RepID=UPI000218F8F0|nr:DapH/DapD/GlmU-related protein [Vibrio cholerae]EGR03991.1 bacterial transferase hexapeptide family protein [Vibrio cholerae HE39]EGR4192298.1 UDP-3-O-(3-hydroxymyristoyl)glucosamine N-acyltransferase [Vibrio cholerae]EKL33349.1 bacterial transferase hexapeptide family protein [Vibrio cholerae HE-40]EKL37212.1 bacterial transferase hexapeptide family protein [Vibrio cholerae HE-46]ORP15217.1 UDP-3-O-(3-hydroxymyristoyl)glucosamine N-acyltransferase [Vibrio cholerae]
MSTARIFIDRYAIKELRKHTEIFGEIIESPYEFKTISSISNFSIVFNAKESAWLLEDTDSVAIIIAKVKPDNFELTVNKAFCICKNPRDIYSYLMNFGLKSGRGSWALRNEINFVHPTAKIHPSTQLGSNVYINADVEIGANCSIGFQGFGFGRIENEAFRLLHTGGVYIGKKSKISNNVTIVAGTFDATTVGDNVLVDDHVHIAHNCRIGNNATLTAATTLSGSTTVGSDTWLGPNSSIINGAKIGDGVFVGIGACVTKSFECGVIAGNPAKQLRVEK